MTAATAPVLVGCLLLVVAGVGKLRRPALTVGALRSVGVRVVSRSAVRLLGAAEVGLALATALRGGLVLTALVAGAYATFTGFVVVALRRGGAVSSCGCLGRPDTPPTRTHAVVTATLAVGCALAAAAGGFDPGTVAPTATDVTVVVFTGMGAWFAWLAFAVLPHARLGGTEER